MFAPLQGKVNAAAGSADVDGLTNRLALLEALIEACRTIATKLDPMEATAAIISQTLKVLMADRATIFTKDPHSNHLVLTVAEGARNIRVPIGKVSHRPTRPHVVLAERIFLNRPP